MEEMKGQLSTQGGEAKNLYDIKMKQEADLDALRKQIEALNIQIGKLEQANKQLKAELAELNATLDAEKAARASAENKGKSLAAELEETSSRLSKGKKEHFLLSFTPISACSLRFNN